MKRFSITSLVIAAFALSLFTKQAYGQQADSLKRANLNYLRQTLSVTEQKAEQVQVILNQYKENAKLLISDKNLTEDTRRAKFEQLVDDKNSRLKKILTEEQSNKLIPTTERSGNKEPLISKP
ncbi:MAG: hypothetical protein WBP45_12855 [Daejeonella sp.]